MRDVTNVVVAFSKPEDARGIKNILMKSGFTVVAVCTSGAQTVASLEELSGGIVVCGCRFADMAFHELHGLLPVGFEMLLVASPSKWSGLDVDGIICLPMPLKVHDLVTTLSMMCQAKGNRRKDRKQSPPKRSQEEQAVIEEAKRLLMERNQMSEREAHHYIQKCSMGSGCNLAETARMVISLNNQ